MAGAFSGLVQIVAGLDEDSTVIETTFTPTTKVKVGLTMPAATAGELTWRGSDTEGIITTTAAHSFENGDIVAIFWDGGYCYDCTVDSHTTDTITFTATQGDPLPASGSGAGTGATGSDTAVTIGIAQVPDDFYVVGSTMQLMFTKATSISSNGLMVFYDVGGIILDTIECTTTGPFIWPRYTGETGPFSGTATAMRMYSGVTNTGRLDCVIGL